MHEVTIGFKSGRTFTDLFTEFKIEKNGLGELSSVSWTLHEHSEHSQILRLDINEIEFISVRRIRAPMHAE